MLIQTTTPRATRRCRSLSNLNIVFAPDHVLPPNTTRMRMGSRASLLIHEVLPSEIMVIIFEEHAKLEWFAPVIDGRVCRVWRQIILHAPRAWTYIEIAWSRTLRISDLLPWLDRSRTAPLHITVSDNLILSNRTNYQTLNQLLFEYHARIASLQMHTSNRCFSEGPDFPCMQHLHIMRSLSFRSPPVSRSHMPNLRSLCLGPYVPVASLDALAPLRVLVLFNGKITSLSQHSPSLVTLMLHSVKLADAISGSVDFPSLTYLSLYDMSDLKPHINAPYLVTYHEYNAKKHKSFSAPVHSLVEYGLLDLNSHRLDLTKWHSFFPNISRLSIRVKPHNLISLLNSLSIHPQLLPALQMISVGHYKGFTKKAQGTMEDLVRVRSEACHMDVTLYFEPEKPMHIPLFFGQVGHQPAR